MSAFSWKSRACAAVGAVAALLLAAGSACAGDPEIAELRARMEKLEKENAAVQQALHTREAVPVGLGNPGGASQQDVRKMVDEALKDKEVKDKAQKSADGYYQVGTDLSMSASWKNGLFLTT